MVEWSAIVTGGASGLGLAVAQEMARRGAYVVAADLPVALERVERANPGIHLVPTDVCDERQVADAVEAAASAAPLRLLVTCAGIATPGRVLTPDGVHPRERFRKVLDVNLTGTFDAVRLAANKMRDNDPDDGDRGVIVMTASVASFEGQIGQAAYSASKGAVAAMTLPLARDLAEHKIRVVSLAPGMFDTPLLAGLPKAAIESLSRQVPHPSRFGRPAEFASLVGHVLDNRMLNGETIRIDGAIRMGPE